MLDLEMFSGGEITGKRSDEYAGTDHDEENLPEVLHVIVEHVQSDEEIGGDTAKPQRDRIEQDERDDGRYEAVHGARDDERPSYIHLARADQTHDRNLFFGHENGEPDGVVGDENGNDDEEYGQREAEPVGRINEPGQAVNRHLVLVIVHFVYDGRAAA